MHVINGMQHKIVTNQSKKVSSIAPEKILATPTGLRLILERQIIKKCNKNRALAYYFLSKDSQIKNVLLSNNESNFAIQTPFKWIVYNHYNQDPIAAIPLGPLGDFDSMQAVLNKP